MGQWSDLIKEIEISSLDLTYGVKFYNEVIINPEYKIQKIAEWELRQDKKFKGAKKPKPVFIADSGANLSYYKDTVVYFFVVEQSVLYIGQTVDLKQRMSGYSGAGRTNVDDKKFIPSGKGLGGATNAKINQKVTSFKLTNENDTIKIYSAFYKVPEKISILPNNGEGILSGEFNIAVPPSKVEKYYLSLFKSIEGGAPKWQSNIDYDTISR